MLIVLPLISFLLQKALLSPFFPKYMPFFDSKITTSVTFLENSFISAGIFCQLPLHFQSPFPSVWSLKRYVLFFLPVFSSVLVSTRFRCYKCYRCCNPTYFWTNYTFCLLNISTLKFVSCPLFQFINVMIFHCAEIRDLASSYIHPPLIFGHS